MRRLTAASPEGCRKRPPCSSEWAGSAGDGCGSEGGWYWPEGNKHNPADSETNGGESQR